MCLVHARRVRADSLLNPINESTIQLSESSADFVLDSKIF